MKKITLILFGIAFIIISISINIGCAKKNNPIAPIVEPTTANTVVISPTIINTVTVTPSESATEVNTVVVNTSTATKTNTISNTATNTPTSTNTYTKTNTPTITNTSTATATATTVYVKMVAMFPDTNFRLLITNTLGKTINITQSDLNTITTITIAYNNNGSLNINSITGISNLKGLTNINDTNNTTALVIDELMSMKDLIITNSMMINLSYSNGGTGSCDVISYFNGYDMSGYFNTTGYTCH